MNEPDKLFQLLKLANRMAIEAMKIGINPDQIAIRLSNDYWFGAISDRNFMTTAAVYHPESRLDKFKLYNVTFYNDKSMPDWMKK